MADDVGESYRSSLSDLKFNSKPLINMLTMLAEEEEQNAPQIVQAIEQHIAQVKTAYKLPVLYLIDSIIKNLTSTLYPKLFAQNIVQMFCSVFEEVDERTRGQMFKLRQTWKDILPNKKLYALDVRVNMIDPAWPITAHAPEQTTIHVNPKFLMQQMEEKAAVGRFSPTTASPPPTDEEELMRRQLIAKEQELQKMRLELELAETKAKLQLQRKQLEESKKTQKVDSDRSIWQALQINPLTSSSGTTTTSETKPQPAIKRDPRLASRDPRKARTQAQIAATEKAKASTTASSGSQPSKQPSISSSTPLGMNVNQPIQPNHSVEVSQNFAPQFPPQLPLFMNTVFSKTGITPAHSETNSKHPSSNKVEPAKITGSQNADQPKTSFNKECTAKTGAVTKGSDKQNTPLKKDSSQKVVQKKDGDSKSPITGSNENEKKKNEVDRLSKIGSTDSKSKDKDVKTKDHTKSRSRSPRDKHKNDKSKDPKPRHERKSSKERERDRRPISEYSRRRSRETEHIRDRGKPIFRGHRGDFHHGDFDRSKHRDIHDTMDKSPSRSRSPGGDHLRKVPSSEAIKTKSDANKAFVKVGKLDVESETKTDDVPMPPIPPASILTDAKKRNIDQPAMEMPLDLLLPKESEKQMRPSKRSSEHLDIDERNLSIPGPDDKRQRMDPLKLMMPKPSSDLSDLFGGEDVDYRRTSGLLPMKSPLQAQWNTFKASHPDEYGPEMEKLSSKSTTPELLTPGDVDMRKMPPLSPFSPSPQKATTPLTLSLPKALRLDHQEEILIQAHKQLESGKMSHDQHQNLLKQLSQVYSLQRREMHSPGSLQNQSLTPAKFEEIRRDPRLASKQKSWAEIESGGINRDPRLSARKLLTEDKTEQSPKSEVNPEATDIDHRKKIVTEQNPEESKAVDPAISAVNKDDVPSDVDDRHIKKDKLVLPKDTDARQVDKVSSSTSEIIPSSEIKKEKISVPVSKEKESSMITDPRVPTDIDSRQITSVDSKSNEDKDFRKAIAVHPNQQMDVDSDSNVLVDKDLRIPAGRSDRDPLLNESKNYPQSGRHPMDKDLRVPFDRNRNPVNGDERYWASDRDFSEDRDFRRHPPSEFIDHDFRHESHIARGEMLRHPERHHLERYDQRPIPHRNEGRCPEFGIEERRDVLDERNFHEPRPYFPTKRPPKADMYGPRRHSPYDSFSEDYHNLSISKPEDTRSDIDRYDDPRWVTMRGMTNAEMQEEVMIDKRPYEIKVGGQPRKIRIGPGRSCVLYVDPVKRGVIIDGKLVYRFGEPVKDVNINGKIVKLFFHGLPRTFWIDGHQYELRIDAPPKRIIIDGIPYGFQIDGRDMMILVDRMEKGTLGGPPREIILNNKKHEIRFDPLPREILIDGQFCELKLDRRIPVVIYKGRPHGIRFDGPPRTVYIDDFPFVVPMDDAVRVKIRNRPHYLAFGGPAHEIIIDGKWFEVKFDNVPREILLGNNTHTVRLEGPCPTVKILDEIPIGYEEMMKTPLPSREHAFRSPGIHHLEESSFSVPNRMIGPVRTAGPRPEAYIQRPVEPNHDSMMQGPRGPGPNPMMQGPRTLGPDGMMSGPRGPMVSEGMQQRFAMPGTMPQAGMMPQLGAAGLQQGLGLQGFNPLVSQQMQIQSQMPGMIMAGLQNLNQLQLQQQLLPVSMGGLGIGGLLQQNALATTSTLGVPVLSNLIPAAVTTPASAPPIDINSLFQKLLATGIIKKPESAESSENKKEETKTEEPSQTEDQKFKMPEIKKEVIEKIPPLSLSKPEDFKKPYKGVVQELYTGLQCTSCGERFSFLQTERYREHLDWHFRKNKRGMDDLKVARNRDWYFKINEWIQYQEIEESEEKGRSQIFEQMMQNTPMESTSVSVSLPHGSVVDQCPAASDEDGGDICCICGDPFDQYWHEEKEDWHLRDAIRVDNKIYHPVCYEDAREEGGIVESTPTPTTDLSVNPLSSEIKNEESKDPKDVNLPQSTLLEKSEISKTENPEIQQKELVKSNDISSVEIKQEPVDADVSAKSELASDIPHSAASVVVKQEPVAVEMIISESVGGEQTSAITSVIQQISSVKTEPASQTSAVKTDVPSGAIKTEAKD